MLKGQATASTCVAFPSYGEDRKMRNTVTVVGVSASAAAALVGGYAEPAHAAEYIYRDALDSAEYWAKSVSTGDGFHVLTSGGKVCPGCSRPLVASQVWSESELCCDDEEYAVWKYPIHRESVGEIQAWITSSGVMTAPLAEYFHYGTSHTINQGGYANAWVSIDDDEPWIDTVVGLSDLPPENYGAGTNVGWDALRVIR